MHIRHSGFQDGKYHIYSFYQSQPSIQDALAFFKKEYGIGGHSHTFLDGQLGFVDDGKGLDAHYTSPTVIKAIYSAIESMGFRGGNVLEPACGMRLSACEKALTDFQQQIENAKTEIARPFAQEEELKTKAARLAELDALLNMDKKQSETLDAEPDNDAMEIERKRDACAR